MHSQRFNHIIIQKTVRGDKRSATLRGVYSSQRKATAQFDTIKDEEYTHLARFYNREPNLSLQKDRAVITVTDHTITIIVIKVP